MGRWTIAGGLGLIALIAVSLAAIREATPVWEVIVCFCSAAVLAMTTAMAILRDGRRAAWVGFSAVGVPYFLLIVTPVLVSGPIPDVPVLSGWIDSVSSRLAPPPPPIRDLWLPREEWMKLPLEERRARSIEITRDSEMDREYTVAMTDRRRSFAAIAHSLLSLVFGMIGALLVGLPARWSRKTVAVRAESVA